MCSPKKLTINLAIESIDSLKKRASKLKNIECPKTHVDDPCLKRIQIIPAPIRRIEKKQIEICKCPTVEFVCPPVPCVCPPCPICPTRADRLKTLLKVGFKFAVFYVMAKSHQQLGTSLISSIEHAYFLLDKKKIGMLRWMKSMMIFSSIADLTTHSIRWTVNQQLWGTADHTSELTNYYKSIVNAIVYGEQKSSEMALNSPPGFFEIRRAVYKTQVMWNKMISTLFYVTIGLPVQYMNMVKESIVNPGEKFEEDE